MNKSERYLENDRVLRSLVDQLRRNTEKVPVEVLRTKYRRAYMALVDSIWQLGEQMVEETIEVNIPLPVLPEAADTKAYLEAVEAIRQEERQPGGLYDQMKAALIQRQDVGEYYELVAKLWERFYTEQYDAYLARHCRWVGKPGNRWIYCDIFNAWWYQEPKYENLGHWIIQNGERAPIPCYQPSIGPDPMKEVAVNA